MRKKILILTLNDYILYQPTILNLYDFLSPHADVTIVSVEPKSFTTQKDKKRNIIYLKPGWGATWFYSKTDFIISKLTPAIKKLFAGFYYEYKYYTAYLPSLLNNFLKSKQPKPHRVIAVDLAALWVAQQHFGAVDFLSLEIENKASKYYQKIDNSKIKSVFVQSKARYDYLFPGVNLKHFIVQNSPVYKRRIYENKEREGCIWAGTIDYRFGVLECMEFFNIYAEYKLVLKGGAHKKTMKIIEEKYHQLLEEKRVVINRDYLNADAFLQMISGFRIGFCFYSWQLIESSFNYQTAPSGKLFMYLAAGTPVIASNIPGFDFVKEFGAGVLVNDYEPATIKRAIDQIEENYEAYSEACYKAAAYYSFDNHVQPYVEYLLS